MYRSQSLSGAGRRFTMLRRMVVELTMGRQLLLRGKARRQRVPGAEPDQCRQRKAFAARLARLVPTQHRRVAGNTRALPAREDRNTSSIVEARDSCLRPTTQARTIGKMPVTKAKARLPLPPETTLCISKTFSKAHLHHMPFLKNNLGFDSSPTITLERCTKHGAVAQVSATRA